MQEFNLSLGFNDFGEGVDGEGELAFRLGATALAVRTATEGDEFITGISGSHL